MSLQVSEIYVNRTEGHIVGDSGGFYEARAETPGELFRDCQAEYGRCTSKIYVDRGEKEEDNTLFVLGATFPQTTETVGWVFEKETQYTDCDETYIQETWVEYKQ